MPDPRLDRRVGLVAARPLPVRAVRAAEMLGVGARPAGARRRLVVASLVGVISSRRGSRRAGGPAPTRLVGQSGADARRPIGCRSTRRPVRLIVGARAAAPPARRSAALPARPWPGCVARRPRNGGGSASSRRRSSDASHGGGAAQSRGGLRRTRSSSRSSESVEPIRRRRSRRRRSPVAATASAVRGASASATATRRSGRCRAPASRPRPPLSRAAPATSAPSPLAAPVAALRGGVAAAAPVAARFIPADALGAVGAPPRDRAASRRAQSWNVGQTGNALERQYASWWASARGAGRASA